MKRYVLTYKNENIFKDQRSFKTKEYAKKRIEDFKGWNVKIEIEEINIKTTEEKLNDNILMARKVLNLSRARSSFSTTKWNQMKSEFMKSTEENLNDL